MEEESKISVWVCREEKLVSGLTRRTTCADVVRVLLDEQGARLSGAQQSYCVVEKWRGFERILPNKTRLMRLWAAWGDEQENVRFVLVRNDASLPSGPRSAEAKVVPSKDSPAGPRGHGWTTVSQEKQRRVVRKAFRKLDKMNRKKEQVTNKDDASVERMETLVHLVVSQDHTIRQQHQRMRELDRDIERYEANVHLERVQRHGLNYVQDTYLLDAAESSSAEARRSIQEALAQFEEYALRCEELVCVQDELSEREELVDRITAEIQEELNQRWMERRRDEAEPGEVTAEQTEDARACEVAEHTDAPSENELALEQLRIQTQLDTSLYIGLRLKTDLDSTRAQLDSSLLQWQHREQDLLELLDLLAREDSVDTQDTGQGVEGPEGTVGTVRPGAELDHNGTWVEQARGLSKSCNNDEDSDTGLSSMHSQDSDHTPVCESLV
ncbi:ras association domain-containing protein 10 [Eucyclogobius newberryi]|uniref:ras association domain-containing protein 10 n=1 Tax=Eucyclogobius newberryi TaxID=166745 RepID=UPI003B5B78D1